MKRLYKKQAKTAGLPPGTLVYIGKKQSETITIDFIDYTNTKLTEKKVSTIEECFPFNNKHTVTWVNINGIHDKHTIRSLGKHFELHPLVLEDVLNTNQRAKFEDFEKYIFLVLKVLHYDEKKKEVHTEQVSLILGKNYVISLEEHGSTNFLAIKQRIQASRGRVRKLGSDYLFYVLIDNIIDNYTTTLEKIGDEIEATEERLIDAPSTEVLDHIRNIKHELILLRRAIGPLKEVFRSLIRSESTLIKHSTAPYLRDVHDHAIQVIDTIDTFRDMVSGMLDVHLSVSSNKMNEVMKVLTTIATIFIPLTFIVGVYGMNFDYFPELQWKYSYPILWIFMIAIGILMFVYFKKREWV